MAIRYNPDDAVNVIPAGTYTATIVAIEEKKSKAGNDMAEVTLKVYAGDREHSVWDYWVFTKGALWKVKQVAKALGINFDAGVFNPDDYLNKNVKVDVTTQKQAGYDEKNVVQEYLSKDAPRAGGDAEEIHRRINHTPIGGKKEEEYATSFDAGPEGDPPF